MTTASTRPAPAGHTPSHRLTADERRAEIVEAAVKAFASGGLPGTSTEDIARLAGVSQPYLFRLFGTKRDLFLAAVGRSFDRIGEAFEERGRRHRRRGGAADGAQASRRHRPGPRVDRHARTAACWRTSRCCGCSSTRSPPATTRRSGTSSGPRFSGLVPSSRELSGTDPLELRAFFAEGMLLNVAAAMELSDDDVAWQLLCEGGPA